MNDDGVRHGTGTGPAAAASSVGAVGSEGSGDVEGPAPLGPAFRRLWAASSLSNLADGVLKVALPLVAVRYTRSPALVGGLAFTLTLPWLLFALPAGALADRLDRRRLMFGANLGRALVVAALVVTIALDLGSIWVLYAAALGIGISETIYDTSAQSILPQIVRRDQLSRANGRLYAAELMANEFVGPPLGGVLVAAGVALAFATPAGLWLVAVGALLLVRGPFRIARDAPTTIRADIAEGLRYLWRNRLLRTMAIMTGGFNFASNATFAILVLYAVGPGSAMQLSEPAFGVLLATVAAGSLVGSLIAERVEKRLGRARALALAFLLAALLVGAPGVTAEPVLIGLAFFVGGVAIVTANIIIVSLRQTITPGKLLGRVNSGYRLFGWGTRPLGAVAGGLLGQLLGLRPVFLVMGALTLTLLLGMKVVTDQAMETAERDAEGS
jgi:MFS family permease